MSKVAVDNNKTIQYVCLLYFFEGLQFSPMLIDKLHGDNTKPFFLQKFYGKHPVCPKPRTRKEKKVIGHTLIQTRKRGGGVRHTNQVGNCFHHSPRLYISPSAFVQRDEIKTGVRGMLSHL